MCLNHLIKLTIIVINKATSDADVIGNNKNGGAEVGKLQGGECADLLDPNPPPFPPFIFH